MAALGIWDVQLPNVWRAGVEKADFPGSVRPPYVPNESPAPKVEIDRDSLKASHWPRMPLPKSAGGSKR